MRMMMMMASSIGYWAAQEQYSMHQLLEFVVEAEKAGFTSTITSDHFHPWWHDNAFGNFTWTWMAAAGKMATNIAAKYSDGVISYLSLAQVGELLRNFDMDAKKSGRDLDSLEK